MTGKYGIGDKFYSKISPAGAMAESADATDLKSVGRDTVRVRPPLAPHNVIASFKQ